MFSARPIRDFSRPDICLPRSVRGWMLATLLACALTACGVTEKVRPFKIDVRQGNYVTQEMLAQLSPGLTEEQVRFIMGTPLLIDPFHANRWDYVYRYAPQGKVSEMRRVTLLFKDAKLASVEGDVVAGLAAANSATKAAPPAQSAPRATP